MMLTSFILLFTFQNVLCHSQTIQLPEKVQPAEVNSLQQHNHHARSISHTPDALSQNNIEETVKEVEAMLIANPTLPRLTRGEILDLLENITQADMAKSKLKSKNEETKERDPKAIMVVMPYTPSNGNDVSMEELYTKPPVTHIVGALPFKKAEDYSFKRIPPEISSIPALGTNKKSVEESKNNTVTTEISSSYSTSTSTELPALPQYTAKKTGSRRRRPTPNIPTATPGPTTYHPSRRPIRRRITTTERYPNHKYPDESSTHSTKTTTSLPSSGIKIIDPPKFSPSEINDDLLMQENRQGALAANVGNPVKESDNNSVRKESSTGSPLMDLVPDNLKGVLADINSQTKTPSSTSTTTKTPPKMEEKKVKDMLAALGVLAVKTTSTTTQVPDISNVADNLTPEMKELLMSFGLIPNANAQKPNSVKTTTENAYSFDPVKADVQPEAYAGFKPLPETDSARDDMEEFLARFGLGRNSRKEKSLNKKREEKDAKKDAVEDLNFEAVPEEYMAVLKDIGLTERQGKMIRTEPLVKIEDKQHVFNPGEPQYASNEELEKLTKLLGVVRQLERLNGSVTDEDLKKIDLVSLKEVISSLNEENMLVPLDKQTAPNPVNFDIGLEKNEVKRQQNSTTTTTVPPMTSTEEAQTPNLKDLEASFGGQVDESPASEEPQVETTTEARKTGFYYLVDWNSFLDIDDQKGKRVNLRFQPKVGDPKRFYSVSVP